MKAYGRYPGSLRDIFSVLNFNVISVTSVAMKYVLELIKLNWINWNKVDASMPCHHGMEYSGDGLRIWRVPENILNKKPRTADKGWPSSFGGGVWSLLLNLRNSL
jgi:hypothetical protein